MAVKRIHISNLRVGMTLAKSVYDTRGAGSLLLLPHDTVIVNEAQIKRLMLSGVKTVDIDTEKGADTFLRLTGLKTWDDLVREKKDQAAIKHLVNRHINNFIESFTATIMKTPKIRLRLGDPQIPSLIKDIMIAIERNIDVLLAIIRLKALTEYTYRHTVHTTVLCLSLAKELGFKYRDIVRFGTGAMLADIGMTSYPPRMIKRPSGLNRREIDDIKKHPVYAVEFLKKVGMEDPLVDMLVLQHHERYDGSGYPFGLKEREIHAISHIFSIADVYTAMTSDRPHRPGMPPYQVLREIHRLSGSLFDPKAKDFFIKHMGVFPVGSFVELSKGSTAIVAGKNPENPLFPRAIVFKTHRRANAQSGSDLIISRGSWDLVDLAGKGSKFGGIKRGLDHRVYTLNPDAYLEKI